MSACGEGTLRGGAGFEGAMRARGGGWAEGQNPGARKLQRDRELLRNAHGHKERQLLTLQTRRVNRLSAADAEGEGEGRVCGGGELGCEGRRSFSKGDSIQIVR